MILRFPDAVALHFQQAHQFHEGLRRKRVLVVEHEVRDVDLAFFEFLHKRALPAKQDQTVFAVLKLEEAKQLLRVLFCFCPVELEVGVHRLLVIVQSRVELMKLFIRSFDGAFLL